MRKKLLFFVSALSGIFLSSCNANGSSSTPIESPSSEVTKTDTKTSEKTNPVLNQFTITFKDENGVTLESKKWDEGTIPSYDYEKQDTAEWDYTVNGWSLTQGAK